MPRFDGSDGMTRSWPQLVDVCESCEAIIATEHAELPPTVGPPALGCPECGAHPLETREVALAPVGWKPAAPAPASPPVADAVGPHAAGSPTSKRAAVDNYPRSGSQRHRILLELVRAGAEGRTRAELAERLGLVDSAADARVWELLRGEWVFETTATRRTRTGSNAAILLAAAKAIAAVDEHEPDDATFTGKLLG